jgi:ankyrin repeat protein
MPFCDVMTCERGAAAWKQGVTPAFKAAASGAMDMLQRLIEAGADLNLCATSKEGGGEADDDDDADGVLSPMRLPSKMQPANAAPEGLAVTPLQAAAAAGHAPAVQLLASNVRVSRSLVPAPRTILSVSCCI